MHSHVLKASPLPYVKSAFSPYIREDNTFLEFDSVANFCRGLGIDIGCGTNRFSDTVMTVDSHPHIDADMVWDCLKAPYPFRDNSFDFVFASHVIEDFAPDQIQGVFDEWLRVIKPGGYMVLLVPDIARHRYPGIEERWSEADELVQKGERNIGDLKGNCSHRICMGLDVLHDLIKDRKVEVVQEDTLPQDQMTLDFVIRKL